MLANVTASGVPLRATSAVLCSGEPRDPSHRGLLMYEKPKLERLGTLRNVTLAGWAFAGSDAVNPFHRYTVTG